MLKIAYLDTNYYNGSSRYWVLGIFVISCVLLLQNSDIKRNPVCKEVKFFVGLVLFTYFISLLWLNYAPFTTISQYFVLLLPPLSMCVVYSFTRRIENKKYADLVLLCAIIFLFYNYLESSALRLILLRKDQDVSNSAYFLLYMLPLLLCAEKKYIRIIAVLFVSFAIISSSKRGGLVAFGLGGLLYVWFEYVMKNKLKTSNLLLLVIIILVAYDYLLKFSQTSDLLIFERIAQMNEGDDSGRSDIYDNVLSMITNSEPISLLLGHGYNSVMLSSQSRMSAHNDFLEIVYDFGIIASVIYITFWGYLVRKLFVMRNFKSSYTPAYAFTLGVFLINSMVAHIYIYPYYLLLFSISFGYIWGLFERERCYSVNIKDIQNG